VRGSIPFIDKLLFLIICFFKNDVDSDYKYYNDVKVTPIVTMNDGLKLSDNESLELTQNWGFSEGFIIKIGVRGAAVNMIDFNKCYNNLQLNAITNINIDIVWVLYLLKLKSIIINKNSCLVRYTSTIKNLYMFKYLYLILYRDYSGEVLFQSFFLYYQNLFLQKLINIPTQIKNFNLSNFLPKELLCVLMYGLKHIKWWKYEIKHSNQLIELLLISIQFKNLNLVMRWIKSYFEKRVLKKHKKLFIFLKYLFLTLIWKFQFFFNIKGVRLYLKGKIGKAGSVRKSKKMVQRGKVSYTTKSLALISEKIVIRTLTGTMGLKLELFF
jgi:hypothetical protein